MICSLFFILCHQKLPIVTLSGKMILNVLYFIGQLLSNNCWHLVFVVCCLLMNIWLCRRIQIGVTGTRLKSRNDWTQSITHKLAACLSLLLSFLFILCVHSPLVQEEQMCSHSGNIGGCVCMIVCTLILHALVCGDLRGKVVKTLPCVHEVVRFKSRLHLVQKCTF